MQSLKSKNFKNFEEKKLNKALVLRGGYGGGEITFKTVYSVSEGGPDAVIDVAGLQNAKGYTPSV